MKVSIPELEVGIEKREVLKMSIVFETVNVYIFSLSFIVHINVYHN